MELIKQFNITHITSHVDTIQKCNNLYNVYFKNRFIKSKFVIEGTGDNTHIGIHHNYTNFTYYRQYFYGYKLRFTQKHTITTGILIDWYNPSTIDTPIKSFGYIIPIDNYTLLVEETILSTTHNTINYYSSLRTRLLDRIKQYNFTDFEIIDTEIYSIPLNQPIQSIYSDSFGIGQAGNMINIISGYTIGYNIYHIPEYCDTIIKSNFNIKKTITEYWDIKRIIINKINTIGLLFMENLSQKEISKFHYYYFKYIVPSYNFKLFFLNCDNKQDFSWIKMTFSFYNYIYFPKIFLIKIAKAAIGY